MPALGQDGQGRGRREERDVEILWGAAAQQPTTAFHPPRPSRRVPCTVHVADDGRRTATWDVLVGRQPREYDGKVDASPPHS